MNIVIAHSLSDGRSIMEANRPDLVIIDLLLPDGRGLDLLPENPDDISLPYIIITSHGDEQLAVEAMKAGALDYVVKSESTMKDMPHIVQRALREWENIEKRKHAEEESRQSLIRLHKTTDGIINAMGLTIEARDPYTAGHQKKVANLAQAIAAELGLSRDQIEGIRMASLIHDLGKIYVPSEILSKPGRISEAEFDIIKSHPTVGYDILKTIDFSWPIATLVLQHHERMDGSGYPNGLRGEEILIEARIINVADVVEAMATHRPYRASLGIDVALQEIISNRGTLYDANVVDCCIRLIKEQNYAIKE
jgi:putative nucleotidyltransferase with HDIG domain